MADVTQCRLRAASHHDTQFITSLFLEGVKNGHYDELVSPDNGNQKYSCGTLFEYCIFKPLIEGTPINMGAVSVRGRAVVYEDGKSRHLGFVIFRYPIEGDDSYYNKLEIWMLSLSNEALQKKCGYGADLIDRAISLYSGHTMIVRCLPASTRAMKRFEERGFSPDTPYNYGKRSKLFIRRS